MAFNSPLPRPPSKWVETEGPRAGQLSQAALLYMTALDPILKSLASAAAPAPAGAQYVTLANDATLSAERVLTAGVGISLTDNGANNTVVVASTVVSGGLTLASSAGVGTGTTYTVTGLGGYKMFLVWLRGVQHNSGTSQSFRVELSGDGGATWGTPLSPNGGTSFTSATLLSGWFCISRIDQGNKQQATVSNLFGGANIEDSSNRGPINALRFSWSAGNFTTVGGGDGAIDIYGLK